MHIAPPTDIAHLIYNIVVSPRRLPLSPQRRRNNTEQHTFFPLSQSAVVLPQTIRSLYSFPNTSFVASSSAFPCVNVSIAVMGFGEQSISRYTQSG
jgi:hypothetical protein